MTTFSAWMDVWSDGEASITMKLAERDPDTKLLGPALDVFKRRVVVPLEGATAGTMIKAMGLLIADVGSEMMHGAPPRRWAVTTPEQYQQLTLFSLMPTAQTRLDPTAEKRGR